MSEVILDTITGKSTATTITIGSTPVVSASANSMTIRGEGSNQTSIQQGLCKAWMKLVPNTIQGSFNTSSIDDNGTGDFDQNFTNNFSNNDYSVTFGVSAGSVDFFAYNNHLDANITTSHVRTLGYNTSNAHDVDLGTTQITGDLA